MIEQCETMSSSRSSQDMCRDKSKDSCHRADISIAAIAALLVNKCNCIRLSFTLDCVFKAESKSVMPQCLCGSLWDFWGPGFIHEIQCGGPSTVVAKRIGSITPGKCISLYLGRSISAPESLHVKELAFFQPKHSI